jgi:hypothetical protein
LWAPQCRGGWQKWYCPSGLRSREPVRVFGFVSSRPRSSPCLFRAFVSKHPAQGVSVCPRQLSHQLLRRGKKVRSGKLARR